MCLGQTWSLSRETKIVKDNSGFLGEKKEWLVLFAKELLKKEHFDFFIFGHRHFPIHFKINEKSQYFNTGDRIYHFSYLVFDGENVELKKLEMKN